MSKLTLPSWDEIDKKRKLASGPITPLEEFIWNYEPSPRITSGVFREELLEAINFAARKIFEQSLFEALV